MLFETIQALCAIPGVSGCEEKVCAEIQNRIQGYCDFKVDALGNIIAFKKGRKTANRRLMLSAHMDEVGLIVAFAEDSGLLRFGTVGGIDRRVLAGKSVMIGEVFGIIGGKATHLKSAEEKDRSPEVDALFIDIGAKDREEALSLVSLGDRAVFTSHYTPFGDGFLRGRALDDRAGCALMIELIQSDLAYDTHFAFTVQEESGLAGARVAANQIAPDIAIAIETTTACDIPDVPPEKQVCHLGKGPVISFIDRGTLYDMKLYARAMQVAEERGIPCQAKKGVFGGNESRAVQVAGNGARVLAVSAPCRYLHTPSVVAHMSDFEQMQKLLTALIEDFAG